MHHPIADFHTSKSDKEFSLLKDARFFRLKTFDVMESGNFSVCVPPVRYAPPVTEHVS